MTKIFVANLDVVYFFYGFAYVALAVIVFAQVRAVEKSEYRLLGTLWLLGAFALSHAMGEFSEMFEAIAGDVKGDLLWLEIFGLLALIVSYIFLLAFGYRLVNLGKTKRLGLWFPAGLAVLFLGLPLLIGVSSLTVWEISARYFLGFPGAALSSLGLFLYLRNESGKLAGDPVRKYIISSAVLLGIYALFSGLLVPKAAFFPASVINNTSFVSVFGIPPQVVRALAAFGLAWSMWQVVNIFNREQQGALKRSEAKYRLMIEHSNDLIWTLDEQGGFTYFNEVAQRSTGYKLSDWLGKSFAPLILREDLPRVSKIFLETMAGATRHYDVSVYAQDGSILVLSVNTTPVFEAGKIVGTVSFGQDITERKLAEAELRQAHDELERRVEERTAELAESNEQLRFKSLLVDSAKDAVIVHELEGTVIYANEAAYQDRGYTKEEFIGLPLKKITTPENAKRITKRIEDLRRTGSAVFESAHLRKDGSIMNVETHARFFDLEGREVILSVVRDITERKQAKDLSDALNKINAAINSTLDFETIMQAVVAESGQAIGSEVVGILVREESDWVVRHVYGMRKQAIGIRFAAREAGGNIIVAGARGPVVSNDAYNDERFNPENMKKYKIRSLLLLPLIVRGEVTAALCFAHQSAPVAFTDAQVDFGSKLAVSVSLAFENARLLREETNIADTLQRALITIPEKIPGLEFGYLYHSAEEIAEVGGDFYDLFELDDHRAVVVIGDVSGKGLEAATLTSVVKNAIKAYAYQEDSPETIMAKTNELIQKASGPSIFVTLFLGIIDTKSGDVSYCNAGHPAPVLQRKAGSISFLEVTSPVVGVFSGFKYLNGSLTLEPGDALILYTDGLTEARCDGELHGDKRLVASVKKLESSAVGDVPQLIYNELVDDCRCVLSDDLALMAISLAD